MGVYVELRDDDRKALIRPDGALSIGPAVDDETAVLELTVDDAVVIGIDPTAGSDILVTAYLVTTSRNVGVNGATVQIYYSTDKTSTSTTNTIIALNDLAKNTALPQSQLNKRVPEGNYVLGKTDDNEVTVTLDWHYTPKETRRVVLT